MCSTPPRRPQPDLARALAAAARKPTTPPRVRRWLLRLLAGDKAEACPVDEVANEGPDNGGQGQGPRKAKLILSAPDTQTRAYDA